MIKRLVHKKPPFSWLACRFLPLFFLVLLPVSECMGENEITLREAILKTIEINSGIRSEQSVVRQQEGVVQATQGEFDWYLFGEASVDESKAPLPEADHIDLGNGRIIDESRETTVIYAAGAQKKFRKGFTLEPSVSTVDYENNIDRQDPANQATLSIEFVLPLMRGAGEQYTIATERSEQTRLAAAQFLAVYNISTGIFNTISAYWNCLAARMQNDIIEESQQRSKEIFSLVELLVKGGEIEPAILRQARAELYSRRAEWIEGRQSLDASRFSLSTAIGFPPEQAAAPPLAKGAFLSDADKDDIYTEEAASGYIRNALAQRGDYLAAQKTLEAEKILLEKAEGETSPKVDFTARTGYAGLDESSGFSRHFRSLANNATGLNAYAGIRVELPIQNNTAWGEIRTRQATVRKAELDAETLENGLASQIRNTLTALKASKERVVLSGNAAEEYRKALGFLDLKVRGGEASLTELIDMEDRYLEARLKEIEARRDHAVAIARLRFQTGTLLTRTSDHLRIEIADLNRLPMWNDALHQP